MDSPSFFVFFLFFAITPILGRVGRRIPNKITNAELVDFIKIDLFLISIFTFFIYVYSWVYPTILEVDLINPLQVSLQLFLFYFYVHLDKKNPSETYLVLLGILLSIACTLFLKGISIKVLLSLIPFLYLIVVLVDPNCQPPLLILLYALHRGLAQWAFFLLFQLLCYFIIAFLLEKEVPPKRAHLSLLGAQFFLYFVMYYCHAGKTLLLAEPAKLAALLSGSCILFLCLKRRAKFPAFIAFFFYFLISIGLGITSAPSSEDAVRGTLIFVGMHFFGLLGYFLFSKYVTKEKDLHPLCAFYFALILVFIKQFPYLSWLHHWVEGLDLLLLLIGALLFCLS